jgi:membrane associated rhomboid family serine protease
MTEETHPIAALTDAALQAVLRRAILITLIVGAIGALGIWISSGWRNGAMLAVGALISAASIFEWQRLIRLFNAKLDQQKTPRGALLVVFFFLARLLVYAAAIYGSLRCLQGSPVALLCGLGLAMLVLAWEALRLLRS